MIPYMPHSFRDEGYFAVMDYLHEVFMFNEAVKADLLKNSSLGLFVEMLDMEKFIALNKLQESECTNPVYIGSGATFTPDGVLSNEIFGTSTQDRRNRFGWIDLKSHYMYPLAAFKLAAYDRKMADCLYARGRFKVSSNGTLIEDPEGDSGPEALYDWWPKLKPVEKTTETTKEISKFFQKSRDELFLTKWPVIPAFFRDINLSESSGTKSTNLINSKYCSLISYTQSLAYYTEGFGNMTRLTQARVQTIIVEIYQELMIKTVKGTPSKFGMLRRSLAGKNMPFTARLVITAPNLNRESIDQVQVKFGHLTVPLQYICAIFTPFMIHELKNYFDQEFIRGGKHAVLDDKGNVKQVTLRESYDENEIAAMINKFVNSPNTRFDPVMTPPDEDGVRHKIMIEGRFNKDNTTFRRAATYTDIMYIVAERVVQDKHVWLTRYPLDNPNGQQPFKIIVGSTTYTTPCTIGNQVYMFYPKIEGNPLNVFMNTAQMSNTMIKPFGADYDGDQVSLRPVMTKEGNAEAERWIKSNGYIINIAGKTMRPLEKDFLLCQYNLTNVGEPARLTKDANKVAVKYAV